MSTDETRSTTEDRLARTLTAVALATPTVDRTDDLRIALEQADPARATDGSDRLWGDAPAGAPLDPEVAEVDLGESPVIDLDRRRRPGSRRTRLTFAAAAAVLVVLAAVAVLVNGGSDRDESVIATPPPAGAPATGWFLPPDGWDLVSVHISTLPDDGGPLVCPCTQWAAARPGGDPALIDVAESTLDGDVAAGTPPSDPIDVDGRPGTVSHQDDVSILMVSSGERYLVVKTLAVDDETLAAVADSWLDQRDAEAQIDTSSLEVPVGFVGTVLQATDRSFESELTVRIRQAATGRELAYQLAPPQTFREALLSASTITVDGGIITGEGGSGDEAVVAAIGGPVDVTMGGYDSEAPPGDLAPQERRELFAGLREVSTAEWRAALAGADGEVDPAVRDAVDLFSPPLTGG